MCKRILTIIILTFSGLLKAQNGYQTILQHPIHPINYASICGLSNGSALVASPFRDSTVNIIGYHLTKIDSSGHVLWGKDYSFPGGYTNYVSSMSDGSIILTGGQTWSNGSVYVVQSLDSLGNTLWAKGFRPLATSSLSYHATTKAIEVKNHKTLVAGMVNINNMGEDIFLMQLNSSGNVDWTRRIGNIVNIESYPVISATKDGGSVLAFYVLLNNDFDMCVLKFDSIGNTQWSRRYGRVGHDWPAGIEQTNDGGYVVVGISPNQTNFNSEMVLFKIDSVGTLLWG